MKILITGAAGLLGTELCEQLAKDNEVWAVDNLSRGVVFPNGVKPVQIDLSDMKEFDKLSKDFDYIYHYGAVNGTKNFYEKPNFVLANNIKCDFNIFEFAKSCTNLKRLAYASTSEIVSEETASLTELVDIKINNIHNPRWSYRLGKICSENYLTNSTLPWIVFRYFNVFGKNSKPGHFVCDQINKIKEGRFELTGADETRSFCDVRDAMRATIYCTETHSKEVINVGNDREIKIIDAANIIANELGYTNPNWTIKDGLAGSTPNRKPDITKLKSLMPDYNPIKFEDAIMEIIKNVNA
jgi:nucleoside-diphosphate-sugar epimerase